MIKEKINLTIALSFVLGLLTFTSCDDDDPQPEALEAKTDAYIEKVGVGDDAKIAPAFYVQANKELKSVKVKAPGDNGKTYTLTADASSKKVFRFVPGDDDFSTDELSTGDYVFTITSTLADDSTLVQDDAIADADLVGLTIDSTVFDDSKLKTFWTKVDDADSYIVALSDANETLLFNKELASNKTNFAFGTNDNGWLGETKAAAGKTYNLRILAVLYEEGATDLNKPYNVQYISLDKKEVVWK